MDLYYFRRQFIMGECFIEEFTAWKKIKVGKTYYLTVHPDLEANQVRINNKELTALGILVNPYKPELNNKDIMKELLNQSESYEDFLDNSAIIGGRWVLIYSDDTGSYVMNDPTGFRQVYYSIIDDKIWLGSQPNIIAQILNLEKSTDNDLLQFINSNYYENEERFWIGDDTVYDEIKHLLPNHYINLDSNTVKRFWVDNDKLYKDSDINAVVEEASIILKGTINSLVKRYNVMQGLTAGMDSRVLLAASKDVSEEVEYFVSSKNILSRTHRDLSIPKKLSNKLNFELKFIDKLPYVQERTKNYIRANVTMGRYLPKHTTVQYHLDHSEDKLIINGNVGEVGRVVYGRNSKVSIDEDFLQNNFQYPYEGFVKKNLDKWLEEAKPFAEKNNIRLTDLFFMEQRMGNWGSMFPAEQDVAIDEVSPFNNRKLITLLLEVDERYREAPNFQLHRQLINNMWSDALTEPINPLGFKGQVKKAIKNILPDKVLNQLRNYKQNIKH